MFSNNKKMPNLSDPLNTIVILYVDDETENIDAFKQAMEGEFNIITATDGDTAYNIIKSNPYIAILIADQLMPGIKGLELIQLAGTINPLIISIMLTGNATKALAINAINRSNLFGFLEKPVDFTSTDFRQLIQRAIHHYLYNKLKTEYTQGTVHLLIKILDERDGYTHAHSLKVQELSMKCADYFKFSEKEKFILSQGALLHDIGKIGIPDSVLKKPAKLDDEERRLMESHSIRGSELIKEVKELKDIAFIIETHHERPDGKGYPKGLKDKDIPLEGAIVRIADVYDAISSKRPYKEAWSKDKVIGILKEGRGIEFNSMVTDAFLNII